MIPTNLKYTTVILPKGYVPENKRKYIDGLFKAMEAVRKANDTVIDFDRKWAAMLCMMM